jgi:hypothetical protein
LLRAVADPPQAPPAGRTEPTIDWRLRLSACSPSRALALIAASLLGIVALAQVVERLAPQLLAAALIAATLSFLCRTKRCSRRRSRHGR